MHVARWLFQSNAILVVLRFCFDFDLILRCVRSLFLCCLRRDYDYCYYAISMNVSTLQLFAPFRVYLLLHGYLRGRAALLVQWHRSDAHGGECMAL